jgi:cobyrinic acid a,c-diamide synthase
MNIVKYVETGYGRKNNVSPVARVGMQNTIGFVPTSKTSNFCKRRMGLIPPVEYVELNDAIERAGL